MVTIHDVKAAAGRIAPYVRKRPLVSAGWLWFEMGLAADLSGAASIAALLSGKVRPEKGRRVCALVCGAGPDGIA